MAEQCSAATEHARQHDLKTWPEFFADLLAGRKPFELRNNDRDFHVGDELRLHEYDPKTKEFSGRVLLRKVTYILGHRPEAGCAATFGIQPGYVILGITDVAQAAVVPAADERERCIAICEGWMERFEGMEIQYTSPREYACDAINDIMDLIRDGIDPRSQAKEPEANETGPRCGSGSQGSSRSVDGRASTATSELMGVTAGETAPHFHLSAATEDAPRDWFGDLNARVAKGLSAPLEPSAGNAALGELLAKICSHAAVDEAMQDAWNDICTDTGCHPLDVEHGKGKHLTFRPNHWANQVAKRLFVRALKLRLEMPTEPQAAQVSADSGVLERTVRRYIESAVLWIPSEGVRGPNGLDATETIELLCKRMVAAITQESVK